MRSSANAPARYVDVAAVHVVALKCPLNAAALLLNNQRPTERTVPRVVTNRTATRPICRPRRQRARDGCQRLTGRFVMMVAEAQMAEDTNAHGVTEREMAGMIERLGVWR